MEITGKKTELVTGNSVIKHALEAIDKLVDTKHIYEGMHNGLFGPYPAPHIRIVAPVKSFSGVDDDDDDYPLRDLNCEPFIRTRMSGPYISTKLGERGGWFSTSTQIYGPGNRDYKRRVPISGTFIEIDEPLNYESMINLLGVLYASGYKEAIQPLKDVMFAGISTVMHMDQGSIELVGEEKIVNKIISTINVKDSRLINRHILLHGPPGCGKSEIVKEVIRRTPDWIHYPLGSDADTWEHFIQSLDRLMKFLGKSALIIADEIDENGLTRAVDRAKVFKLLRVLDGVGDIGHVKFIATTNRAGDLDEALLRVGRLGPAIKIPKPTAEKRRQIIAFYAGRYEGDVDIDWLCKEIGDASGAEIRAAFENCIIYQEPVTTRNVIKSFKDIKEALE